MDNNALETHEELKSPGASTADDLYAHKEEPTQKVQEEVVFEETQEPAEHQADEEQQADEPSEDEGIEITSVEQLAEHLETDPDWLRNLKVTEKVNGQPIEVSIKDALATHRKVAAGDDYLADAKTKAKAMIEEASQQKQVVAGDAAAFGALLKEAEDLLESDIKGINWERLRNEDPAEYSARKEDARERRERIKELRDRGMQSYKQTTDRLTQAREQEMQKNLPQEYETFLQMVPEWNDEKVAEKERAELLKYLSQNGHSEDEIKMVAYNGKALAYIRNSMLYEKSKGKIDAAKKKVVKIPKVLKPGKPAEKQKPTDGKDDRVSILYGP